MDGRPNWTDCDEAGDYVVPNVSSPRDLVFRPDNTDETVPHIKGTHYANTPLKYTTIHVFVSWKKYLYISYPISTLYIVKPAEI